MGDIKVRLLLIGNSIVAALYKDQPPTDLRAQSQIGVGGPLNYVDLLPYLNCKRSRYTIADCGATMECWYWHGGNEESNQIDSKHDRQWLFIAMDVCQSTRSDRCTANTLSTKKKMFSKSFPLLLSSNNRRRLK